MLLTAKILNPILEELTTTEGLNTNPISHVNRGTVIVVKGILAKLQ